MTGGTGIEVVQNVSDTKHNSNGVDVPFECGMPHVERQITRMLRGVATDEIEALVDVWQQSFGGDGPRGTSALKCSVGAWVTRGAWIVLPLMVAITVVGILIIILIAIVIVIVVVIVIVIVIVVILIVIFVIVVILIVIFVIVIALGLVRVIDGDNAGVGLGRVRGVLVRRVEANFEVRVQLAGLLDDGFHVEGEMKGLASCAVGRRRSRRSSSVGLKDLLYMVRVSMWTHEGFAIRASRMLVAGVAIAECALEVPLKLALEVALLRVSLFTASLLEARPARRERRLRLEEGLAMVLLRFGFLDELANSEALLHRVVAIAQKAFDWVRFGGEGDRSWTLAAGDVAGDSGELVARPAHSLVEQKIERGSSYPGRVCIQVAQERAPWKTIGRFAHGGRCHQLAKAADVNGFLALNNGVVFADFYPVCGKFLAVFLERSEGGWFGVGDTRKLVQRTHEAITRIVSCNDSTRAAIVT